MRECVEETAFLAVPELPRHRFTPAQPRTTALPSPLARLSTAARALHRTPLALAALTPVARFVTPRTEQRRFDTVFFAKIFAATDPALQQPLVADPTEHVRGFSVGGFFFGVFVRHRPRWAAQVSAAWVDAEDVLSGKFRLMPPQVRHVWGCCASAANLPATNYV